MYRKCLGVGRAYILRHHSEEVITSKSERSTFDAGDCSIELHRSPPPRVLFIGDFPVSVEAHHCQSASRSDADGNCSIFGYIRPLLPVLTVIRVEVFFVAFVRKKRPAQLGRIRPLSAPAAREATRRRSAGCFGRKRIADRSFSWRIVAANLSGSRDPVFRHRALMSGDWSVPYPPLRPLE